MIQRRLIIAISALAALLVLSACGRPVDARPIPTVFEMPSLTPSQTRTSESMAAAAALPPTQTLTPSPTATTTPTEAATIPAAATTSPTPSPTKTLTPAATTQPVRVRITSKVGAYVRAGPSVHYDVVDTVDKGDLFPVLAYAEDYDGVTWYLITLADGKPAWVSGLLSRPVGGARAPQSIALAVTVPPTPTLGPTPSLTPAAGLEAELQKVPVLSEIGDGAREIFKRGQVLGNNPHALAKIGDCNTESGSFLRPLDAGNYVLGRYDYLQDTITFFQGSFAPESVAGKVGFNVASVQDRIWADPAYCTGSESPFTCEIRRTQASVAIIMFGANDVLFIPPELYEQKLRAMIEYASAQGVIPVLTTFTRRPDALWDRTLELNMVIVKLAREYDVPLINFWLAARYLPGNGILPDNAHLNQGRVSLRFDGDEKQWGHALRSLLTLQMLDQLRREVLTAG